MSAFNRLHFFKRFDPAKSFVAIKIFTWAGVDYKPGDSFNKNGTPDHKLKRLFDTRKITFAEAMHNPANISAVVEEKEDGKEYTVVELVPVIVEKAFGWITVEVNGEQIGKATRDRKEAERIVAEWLNSDNE